MLKHGKQELNLSQPTTDVEKRVNSRMEEIISEYKLDQGNKIQFVYPKRYLLKSKHPLNIGKIDKPASIGIKYRDVVREKTGAVEWRWYESTSGSDEKGTLRYNPTGIPFAGSWSLGIDRIDLIFFLLDIYSHTEGGKNWTPDKVAFIAIDDKIKDAAEFGKNRKLSLLLENAIYGEAIGLNDENLRILAGATGVIGYRETDIDVIRKQTYGILSKDLVHAAELINNMKKGNKNPEYTAMVIDLKEKNIVMLKGVGKTRKWYFVEGDVQGEEIMAVVGGSTPEAQLADFIVENEVLAIELKSRLAVD
jgi:hypothetical protein